jgi:hypothetical protein
MIGTYIRGGLLIHLISRIMMYVELVPHVTAYACMREQKVKGHNSTVGVPLSIQTVTHRIGICGGVTVTA